VKEFKQWFLKN